MEGGKLSYAVGFLLRIPRGDRCNRTAAAMPFCSHPAGISHRGRKTLLAPPIQGQPLWVASPALGNRREHNRLPQAEPELASEGYVFCTTRGAPRTPPSAREIMS